MQTGSWTRRVSRSVASLGLAAIVPLLLSPAATAAEPAPPAVTTSGVHFVDRAGRIVILRGVDVSYQSQLAEKVSSCMPRQAERAGAMARVGDPRHRLEGSGRDPHWTILEDGSVRLG